MQLFKDRGVKMVDTTCPWVAKVWNSVDQHSRKSYTSVIHGKYSHEETIATASFADTYVIVRDLAEAQMVVDYILNGGDREAFLKHFEKAVSKGFDPDRDLVRVGLANQVGDLLAHTVRCIFCWRAMLQICAGCSVGRSCVTQTGTWCAWDWPTRWGDGADEVLCVGVPFVVHCCLLDHDVGLGARGTGQPGG
jgi:hypothetical protein